MTDVQVNGHNDSRASLALVPPPVATVPRDTSFEHLLDEDGARAGPGPRRRWHRDPESRRGAPADRARAPADAGRDPLDGVQVPRRRPVPRAVPRAALAEVPRDVRGVGSRRHRQAGKSAGTWWWVTENTLLRSMLVVAGNATEWKSQHNHVRKTRSWRGSVLGGELAAVVTALALIAVLCPWWAWLIAAAVAVPPLAHYGRPGHLPIIQSAVTTPLVRKISTDAIVRAYEAAGLCSTDPKKPGRPSRVRVDHDPRRTGQGQPGRGLPAVRRARSRTW